MLMLAMTPRQRRCLCRLAAYLSFFREGPPLWWLEAAVGDTNGSAIHSLLGLRRRGLVEWCGSLRTLRLTPAGEALLAARGART